MEPKGVELIPRENTIVVAGAGEVQYHDEPSKFVEIPSHLKMPLLQKN